MGKRSKSKGADSVTIKSKVNKKTEIIAPEDIVSKDENLHKSKKTITKNKTIDVKIKKDKKNVLIEEALEETSVNKEDKSKIIKKTKQNKSEKNKSNKNKKIIFQEDTGEPMEVSSSSTNKNDTLDEEQVKDEDIDQFCDDITEEDNVQYENWVQLIEAKLKTNKNKSDT